MANDIVQSLFGATPASYQQAQQDRADAQAMRFAQLDPFQQANYAIGRGAYGLAGAVGGALGGQDPELQRISMRQQIAGQIDFGDLQSILAGARELSKRGDIVGAMQAADVARKLDSEMAQAQQRRAAGDASLAEAAKNRRKIAETIRQEGIFNSMYPPETALGTPSITDPVTGTVATPVPAQSADMGAAMPPVGEAAPVPVPAPVPVRARPTLEQDIASLEKQQVALLSLNKIPAAKAQADVLGERIKDLRSQLKPTEIAILEREIARLKAEGIPDTDPRITDRLSKIAKLVGGTSERFGVDREAIAVQEFNKSFSKLTPAEAKAVNDIVQANKKATAPQTNVVTKQENAFAAGLGKGQSERILANQAVAQDAAEILATNQVGRDLLNSGAITGTGANFLVGFNNALKQAGIDFGYADAASNSQAYAAAMGANVGRLIKQFGAGTGLSDADREYAAQMAGGKITLTEASLRKILAINDNAANRVIDLHNKNVAGIKTNIPLTVEKPTRSKPAPSAASQIPGQSPAPAPVYATNGKERIVSTDGGKTWNPVR